MQTLKYFLSDTGIQHFQAWYLDKPSLKSIWQDLDNYVLMLLSTRWTAESERDNIRTYIREYLELHIQLTYKKSAIEIFQEWLNEVNKYCYQGGYGYRFAYPDAPHHWVIKPEFYDKVSRISEEIAIAACCADKYIDISKTAEWEKWSS
jgi:hypothetical protein